MKTQSITNILFASLLLISFNASASTIFYSDKTTFTNTNSGLNYENFDSYSIALHQPYFDGDGFIVDNTISQNSLVDYGIAVSFNTITGGLGNHYIQENRDTDSMNLIFDQAVSAAGMDLLSVVHPNNYILKLYDINDILIDDLEVLITGQQFWGFSSDIAIKKMYLQRTYNNVFNTYWGGIDNLSYKPAAGIPEPTTLLLLMTGISGLFWKTQRSL